jgi:hypothetical protein
MQLKLRRETYNMKDLLFVIKNVTMLDVGLQYEHATCFEDVWSC